MAPESLPPQAADLYGIMLRRAARWPVGAGVLCVGFVAIADGRDALVGAVLGMVIVVGFFAIDVLVVSVMRRAAPELTVFAVLVEYGVKVVALAVFLWALHDDPGIDLHALAVTVVVMTVSWVVALTVEALRSRSYVLDPIPRDREPGSHSPRQES